MQPEQPDTPATEVQRFVATLTPEERMLIVLKRELYEGRWEAMARDLNARLEDRPYVFKLVHRIEDDLRRIDRLARFEHEHGVDLADHVGLDSLEPGAPP